MHVISRKVLLDFTSKHPAAGTPLASWYKIVSACEFQNFHDIKRIFNAADWVEGFVVFDIGGNKYRLIAAVHFNRQKLYIRHVLTHKEYDSGKWRKTT